MKLLQKSRRSTRSNGQYNGFVFRITADDLPAQFSDWILDMFGYAEWYQTLLELERRFRETIIYQIHSLPELTIRNAGNTVPSGEKLVSNDPMLYSRYIQDPAWMKKVFSDNQIILSRSVTANRIIRVVTGSQLSGRLRLRSFRDTRDINLPMTDDRI